MKPSGADLMSQGLHRSQAFTATVQEFQRVVHSAGGRWDWDFWKDQSMEDALWALCTNSVRFHYSGPAVRLSDLGPEDLFPNK